MSMAVLNVFAKSKPERSRMTISNKILVSKPLNVASAIMAEVLWYLKIFVMTYQ